jgi:choloylglycine hydrolase
MYKTIENHKMENARFAEGKALRALHVKMVLWALMLIPMLVPTKVLACTGVRLGTDTTGVVYGRTMEWGGFDLKSQILVVQKGCTFPGFLGDTLPGKTITAKYGFVGLNALELDAIMDGMNEKGLAVGGFYHHNYAIYPNYSEEGADTTISSAHLGNYILGNFQTVKEVEDSLKHIKVVQQPRSPNPETMGFDFDIHWMVTDSTGNSIVIEFKDSVMVLHNSTLGVITNNPYYDWHQTNLGNYINLRMKAASGITLNGQNRSDTLQVSPIGAGSGLLGLPGDNTPPSRFIRATVWSQTARTSKSANDAVFELFRILDNFQLPLGADAPDGESDKNPDLKIMKSDTQWTTAWNLTDRVFNYHTQYNRQIRCLDLKEINFTPQGRGNPEISNIPLDIKKEQEVHKIAVNDPHWEKKY